MKLPVRHLAATLSLLAAASLPALAASSAASSASESLSTSVGSISNSFRGSSDSSTGPTRTTDGDYRVVDVAQADQPGMLALTLQPAAPGQGEAFVLVLPQQAADNGGVAVGGVVRAANRPYGVEFARADNRQAFFLVLDDDWYRELDSHPVTL
jgi:hypothetical protein